MGTGGGEVGGGEDTRDDTRRTGGLGCGEATRETSGGEVWCGEATRGTGGVEFDGAMWSGDPSFFPFEDVHSGKEVKSDTKIYIPGQMLRCVY